MFYNFNDNFFDFAKFAYILYHCSDGIHYVQISVKQPQGEPTTN